MNPRTELEQCLKETQRNWIGRSSGAEVRFKVKERRRVQYTAIHYSCRHLFGVTFMVLAPRKRLVPQLTRQPATSRGSGGLRGALQNAYFRRERMMTARCRGVFSGGAILTP